jgi:prepilin-type processing-associated H-X9-DG protein
MLEMAPPLYGGNTTVALTSIKTLLCPSESLPKSPSFTPDSLSFFGYRGQLAVINYAGNYGGPGMIKACSGTVVPLWGKANVIFNLVAKAGLTPPSNAGPVRIAMITDGTSTTALFSEHLLAQRDPATAATVNAQPGASDRKRGLYPVPIQVSFNDGNVSNAQQFVAACKAVPGDVGPIFDASFGTQWLPSADYATAINAYTHFMTPNSLSCTGQASCPEIASPRWGGFSAAITATSNHPGGVNVAFCDGSVKFVKDSVDLTTWWALGTRAGKEIISGDAY